MKFYNLYATAVLHHPIGGDHKKSKYMFERMKVHLRTSEQLSSSN